MNPVYESHRERITPHLIALSRKIPGGPLLLWLIGADIPAGVRIGRDVRFPHGAMGVVIHPKAVIGDRCIVYHGVTLGADDAGLVAPVVEDGVLIGAGAVVLGGVRLGRDCKVGANAVVLCDVPAGATAVGNPARVLTREMMRA